MVYCLMHSLDACKTTCSYIKELSPFFLIFQAKIPPPIAPKPTLKGKKEQKIEVSLLEINFKI